MKKTNTDIEKTLQSLDGMARAQAPDDFYAKLQAKMNQTPRLNSKWVLFLRAGIAAMIVMGCMNAYLLFADNTEETNLADFTEEYLDNSITLLEY